MKFNINDHVLVKLTDKGRKIHKAAHFELFKSYPKPPYDYTPPREDENGYSRWQLWVLMKTFGISVRMGFDPPFETNIIIEDTESLNK